MHPNATGQMQVVFSDLAKHALDPDTAITAATLPASCLSRAHFVVPGDLVQLPGCLGQFIVSPRIWDVKSGTATLKLVLDVLVQDND